MDNFQYYNPVHILFGEGQVKSLKSLLKDKKTLLLFGGSSIKKNGVYQQVTEQLENFEEFGGIEPNPQYKSLVPAIELAKEKNIDFILAVGGGSVIDAAKFISAAIHHPTDPWGILAKRERIQNTTPMGCVLTLPATGSESNSFSVISNGDEKLGFGGDPKLYPQFAILDPTYTYSLPQKFLANGIADAFVHVLEQYLTVDNNAPLQDRYALSVIKTLVEEAPKIYGQDPEYNSRANLMWCCNQALNGLLGMGQVHDWSTHFIGHEITAFYGVDHARSLAIVLPSLLRVQLEKKEGKLKELGRYVFGTENAVDTIDNIESFFSSLDIPTSFDAYSIQTEAVDKLQTRLQERYPKGFGEHRDIKEDKLNKILAGCFK